MKRSFYIYLFPVLCCFLFLVACKDEQKQTTSKNPILEKHEQKIQSIEATGYGDTRDQAIQNALNQAVKQVYGYHITKESFSRSAFLHARVCNKEQEEKNLHIQISENQSDNTPSVSNGDILSYKIISEECSKMKQWVVIVHAQMYEPAQDAFAHKISLVVTPPQEIAHSLSQCGFTNHISEQVAHQLSSLFRNAFSASQEFVILDRQNMTTKMERESLERKDVASLDKIKRNHLKVADFVLSIQVEQGNFHIQKYTYPVTNQIVYRSKWELTFCFQMIDVASNGVLASSTAKCSGGLGAFSSEKCMHLTKQEIEKQLHQKIQESGEQLTFLLGYPHLYAGKLMRNENHDFIYQFMIKGPHFITQYSLIDLYMMNQRHNQRADKATVLKIDINSNQITLKTKNELQLPCENFCFLVAPVTLEAGYRSLPVEQTTDQIKKEEDPSLRPIKTSKIKLLKF
ncbi:MAG: hypothetical protein RR808_09275 [Akkermansia sp.]